MKKILFLIAAAAVLLVACDKENKSKSKTPEEVVPTGISLDYDRAIISLDRRFPLTATLQPAGIEAEITWRSENPEVATVIDGVVIPQYVGMAKIVAEVNEEISASCNIIVCAFTFDTSNMEVAVDRSLPLSLSISPEQLDLGEITWTSDHPEIATVENGVVTGKGIGAAVITATAGTNLKSVCNVNVYRIIYEEGFEDKDEFESQWTNVDADGDGFKWKHIDNTGLELGGMLTHSGECLVYSESYYNGAENELGRVLTPDNWLFSPSINLSNGTNFLSYWVAPQDNDWPNDKYAVYVASSTAPGDHYMLFQETLVANGTTRDGECFHRVLAIPDNFKGQSVHIAFRHYESTDMYVMKIDDVSVVEGNLPPEPTPPEPTMTRVYDGSKSLRKIVR